MAFADSERCGEIVDAIGELIPADKFYIPLSNRRGARPLMESGRPLGDGHYGQNWYADVIFNPLVPRAWSATLSEPYEVVETAGRTRIREISRRTIERPASTLGDDPRVQHAQFETHGLDTYGADQTSQWDIVAWKVVQTATDGQLGAFAANPIFTRDMRLSAAVMNFGHFALDETEMNAQVAGELKGVGISREATARNNSYRLTTEGSEYLLSVIEATHLESTFKAEALKE